MFEFKLSDKVRSLKPSSTIAVTGRALELQRAGVDVVSMAAGEPDFDTPEHVKEAAYAAIRAGKTRYTPVQGIPELRETICAKFERENGLTYSPEQVTVSTGGKQALFNAFFALLDPGDEVIIPAPYWVSYPEMVAFAGGVPVAVDTQPENGYDLDPAAVARAITPRTRAIVLNSPANPTGAVYGEATLRAVAELAVKHGLLIITDEMYEHIIYDAEHLSIARFAPEHTLTINGASKAYAMTGWRIGYAAGPQALIRAMNAIQGQSTSNANSVAQWAAVAAIQDSSAFIASAREQFRRRRDRIVSGLNDLGLPTPLPQGAFYVMADTSRIHASELEAARIILDDARVAVVPGTDFRAPGRVRLSYATSFENIEKALGRMGALLSVSAR
ncbi:pyridoxal phosphate-dependent aminotransferase [Deinococcus peraridilitoris]|uniref:Aminotransferase n=1 Tax=Deinococcus peraridilitoris (strain DSM 19664 / LMG 22246 / CIP 109416 / KR-200) TaxID=937777 RepID=L0A3I9_DEIPD|nr:pyridoxal phosphate-dependent aminotransferase [Deinococcus peraridilitoris]AFZ68463.1 aspartate/tyrosine/aromatic aminotransferase [Deinococcus peraridilitoris DSM 19664]